MLLRDLLLEMGYSGEDLYRHRFYYPATIAFILLPLWLIPFPIAIILWCGLQLLLVMILPLLVFTLLEWRIPPLTLALVTIFSVVPWRHSANSYVLGQFTLYTLGCLVIARMVVQKRPALAALALVGAPLRAEGIVLAALALLYLLLTRRFRIVGLWAGIMAVLFTLSLLPTGWWLSRFLNGISGYEANQPTTLPAAITGIALPTLSWRGCWHGARTWHGRYAPSRTAPHSVDASGRVPVVLIVLRQSKDYTWSMPVPDMAHGLGGPRSKMEPGLMLLIMISPWIYNAAGANMGHDSQTEQFLTPVLLAGLLTYRWARWKPSYVELSRLEVSGAIA